MRIFLAPMDGLTDHIMREVLTDLGGIDVCVTEFVRITNTLLPNKVFYRACPELWNNGYTRSGVPVRVQLLGSDPVCLAENAVRAAELGAPGVDLNFGCPAKVVNRNKGGAVLLTDPENLFKIVSATRRALDGKSPLSAKMRLGYEDKSLALECAAAIEEGGAQELIVHARTKTEGYRPPAYWDWIAKIREVVTIPVIANGEVWSFQDYERCQQQSHCSDVMIGRGLISNPYLASECKARLQGLNYTDPDWLLLHDALTVFFQRVVEEMEPQCAAGRLKQWLHYLRRHFSDAEDFFQTIRREKSPQAITERLQASKLMTV